MKKKHRDIVVDGQKYGWIARNDYNKWVKIFKTKNEFVKYHLPDYLDITPKIVAGLIKDPVSTLMLINAEPCPFCGKQVERSQHSQYLLCVHEEDCWLHTGAMPMTTIHISQIKSWNKRH